MVIRSIIETAFGSARRDFATKAFLGQVGFSAVAFLGSIAAARVLGPGGKGTLSGWTTFALLAALALGGSSTIGFGRAWLAGDRDVLAPAVMVHGVLALAVSLTMALAAAAFGIEPVALVIFLLITVPATVMIEDLQQVALAAKEALQWQIPRIVNASVFTVGLAVLWAAGWSGSDVLVWALFAGGSVAGWAWFTTSTIRRYGASRPPTGYVRHRMPELGRGTGPFRVMHYMMLRLDWFFVLLLAGPAGLGVYGVAVNWTEIGSYVTSSIGGAVFEDSSTLDDASARRVLKISVVLVGPLTLGLAILAWPLIPRLFGEAFTGAREIVPLLVPGALAQAVSRPAWQVLVARGEGVLVRTITMRTLLIGAPFVFVLTATLGIKGAAIGSSLGYVVWAWLLSRQFFGSGPPTNDFGIAT